MFEQMTLPEAADQALEDLLARVEQSDARTTSPTDEPEPTPNHGGWVARAKAKTLPTYSALQGAYAFRGR